MIHSSMPCFNELHELITWLNAAIAALPMPDPERVGDYTIEKEYGYENDSH